ncbi:MAG: hypothetical protein EA357_01750 [Micavibrio sp.]|jgi:hypothetical protein|nr:MAG: hypothetical protein EA357_01750 [Micavibrio sp.]
MVGAVALALPDFAHATGTGDLSTGDAITNLHVSMRNLPNILTTIAFVAGLFLAVSGVLKLRDHVDNPPQTPISAGVKRLIAGGAFLGLPLTLNIARGSIFGGTGTEGEVASGDWGVAGSVVPTPVALDEVAVAFITNIAEPMKFLMSSFSFILGLALILVGISRLIKTAQEGPRGPTGMGTLFTFIAGTMLMALGNSMGTFSHSLFGDGQMRNYAEFSGYVETALGGNEDQLRAVIGALLMFTSLVGFIAFLRGIYIMKLVADGNQNHSITQSLTFMFGGALAFNLGRVINMLQESLGYAALGISFS